MHEKKKKKSLSAVVMLVGVQAMKLKFWLEQRSSDATTTAAFDLEGSTNDFLKNVQCYIMQQLSMEMQYSCLKHRQSRRMSHWTVGER